MPSDDVLLPDWKALPCGFNGNALPTLPLYEGRPWFGLTSARDHNLGRPARPACVLSPTS